ncbi:MAG TPA: SRPBCC family protein [Candidatus Obscuribacter sp.]|nr:SRPBCC family protein [Candidatus Obscuribacter sp.]
MSEKRVAPIEKRTLPATFYRSRRLYEHSLDAIFARTWQWLTDSGSYPEEGAVAPVTLLPGALNEPLLLVAGAKGESPSCLSNVCTHRGAILVEHGCQAKSLRCRYHGRRFSLDGTYQSAPGFEEAVNFPQKQDHLSSLKLEHWGPFAFASLDPVFAFSELMGHMSERLSFLDLDRLVFKPELSNDYDINAHWALYVDNYLEGLHIPFVHPSLTSVLDLKSYRTELFQYGNLQLGVAAGKGDCFDLPPHSQDYGQEIGAYYYWLFPNMMFNFYPWGLSLNIVSPQGHDRTRVHFRTYVLDETRMGSYSPADIKQTEMEDEDVVHLVQKGIQSRLYQSGRYAPTWEQGVQQFHQLMARLMDTELGID